MSKTLQKDIVPRLKLGQRSSQKDQEPNMSGQKVSKLDAFFRNKSSDKKSDRNSILSKIKSEVKTEVVQQRMLKENEPENTDMDHFLNQDLELSNAKIANQVDKSIISETQRASAIAVFDKALDQLQ